MKRRSFIREIVLLSAAPAIVHAGGFPLQFLPVIKGRPTASGPAVYLQDDFNRADSVSSLGTADVGGAWSVSAGAVWGISSNKAYCPTDGVAFLDASHADATEQVTLSTFAGSALMIFRYTDASNYWSLFAHATGYYIQKLVANSSTNLVGPVGTPTNGDVMKAVTSGNTIQCFVNGSQIGSDQSDSFNNTATKYGMRLNDAAARMDTFLVTA